MNIVKFWSVIIGVIGATLVVASIIYWLNKEIEHTKSLTNELEATKKELVAMQNMVVEPKVVEKEVIKEVFVEVEKECAESLIEPTKEKTIQEVTIRVPKAIKKVECKNMQIGKWDMPKECAKMVADLSSVIDSKKHFLAITAVVDKRKFPGGQNELKQAGLAQFRVATAAKNIKDTISKDMLIFSRKPIQTLDVRGFTVEVFQID